MNKTITLK